MKAHGYKQLLVFFIAFGAATSAATPQGLSISAGTYVLVTGTATIQIDNGNFVNEGIYSKGTEKFKMTGNSAGLMLGSGLTNINDLDISNTGGITTRIRLLSTHDLTIFAGSKFTIDTVSAVNVSNIVTNNASSNDFTIKSNPTAANGTLIFNNATESPVAATVEMYSKASRPDAWKWQYFGIPVQTLIASPTFDGGYVRRYNEAGTGTGFTPDKHWIQLVNNSTLSPFTGYEATQTAAKTFYFAGNLVNSNYDSGQLAYTVGAQYTGQHLIGNPYTAAINIKQINFGTRTEASVYLYNTGSYSDWTNNSGISEPGSNPGQYTVSTKNTAGEGGIPGQIPSMQAFLIKVMKDTVTATISIPYSSVAVKNTDMQRSPALNKVTSDKKVFTRIEVLGSRYGDCMWIFSDSSCTRNFDNGWDGYKLIGSTSTPQLFSIEADGYYQINGVNNIDSSMIGFQKGEDTNYKLIFTHESTVSNYSKLYLIDLKDETTTDISQSGTEYSFSSLTSDPLYRFKITTNLSSG